MTITQNARNGFILELAKGKVEGQLMGEIFHHSDMRKVGNCENDAKFVTQIAYRLNVEARFHDCRIRLYSIVRNDGKSRDRTENLSHRTSSLKEHL